MKTITEAKNKLSQSITFKIGTIAFLILLMLIPTGMIRSLIRERQTTGLAVVNEISEKWGTRQTVTGPVLIIPYVQVDNFSKEQKPVKQYLHILPESLKINGEVSPEIRYRGIYKVVAYYSDMDISGKFTLPDFENLKIPKDYILWNEASLLVGISDMRGIQNDIKINWNNETLQVSPGIDSHHGIGHSGFSTAFPVTEGISSYNFDFDLKLNGSGNLKFVPVGKTTDIEISSVWNTPSFTGAFLPDERQISDSGFVAKWNILQLNRNFPQTWVNNKYDIDESSFGVNLLLPVDQYQKSMRSAKYAIMFIALTFIIFLFVEILNKKRIHPVQYILVSFGLLLFYTLLLSLAEHIGFNLAYTISGVAIVGLITSYSQSIFKKTRLTLIMGGALSFLYIFLFVVLQLQDYALLLGSIGLFIILAIIMYLSRKIDWYSPISHEKSLESNAVHTL
ncbi:MAG: cell envelope integrity protein CreD [Chlorobi bacterium]|nr:cell envelope integrity protein CreD [Chlorobiota bacterium]